MCVVCALCEDSRIDTSKNKMFELRRWRDQSDRLECCLIIISTFKKISVALCPRTYVVLVRAEASICDSLDESDTIVDDI